MWSRRTALTAAAAAALAPALAHASNRRIVSVGGDVTEILCALDLDSELVGVDSTSLFPTEVRALAQVGYLRSLAAEGILSLRPTHLAANGDAGPPATLDQLRRAGVRVFTGPVSRSPQDVAVKIRTLAAEFGASCGEALATGFERRMAETVSAVAGMGSRPRVLFLLSINTGSPSAAGRNTAADAMITLAGGANPITAYEGYRALSLEAAAAARPDVIVMMDHALASAGGATAAARNAALALTPAGRDGRIFGVDGNFLLGFGPRLPEAVRALAHLIRRPA